jgi:hypothetical protein
MVRTCLFGDDAFDPPHHFHGGSAGEGQQQETPWVGAAGYEVSDPVGQRVGLARARPGDNEERARGDPLGQISPVLDSGLLRGVEGARLILSPHNPPGAIPPTCNRSRSCCVRKKAKSFRSADS